MATFTMYQLHDKTMSKLVTDICVAAGFPLLKGTGETLKVTTPGNPYMTLNICDYRENEVSVNHAYTQNGDVMYDPEIVYRVLVKYSGDLDLWVPYMWNDSFGYREYATWGASNREHRFNPRMIRDLISFGRTWASNIREQQREWLKIHNVK